MNGTFCRVNRDAHLYLGLFVSPLVLLFAASVFYLVHAWLPKAAAKPTATRVATALPLPANLTGLSGRERIDALRPVLKQAGVNGEVGWIQHQVKENVLVLPVTVPGRVTTVRIDVNQRTASITERSTGMADALVTLHKMPGPHLAGIRMNWFPMRAWAWLADGAVYLVLFTTLTGIFLWQAMRSERRPGVLLLVAGGISFLILVYGLVS